MGGGAWPFLVGGAICLVNSVNERDLGLLNSHANPSAERGYGPGGSTRLLSSPPRGGRRGGARPRLDRPLVGFVAALLRGTMQSQCMEVRGNNRSVMPLDVLGRTRATLTSSTSVTFSSAGRSGQSWKARRAGDRSLQLWIFNEEFLVSASHQLALITSLPFVHTARRSYRLNGPVKSSERGSSSVGATRPGRVAQSRLNLIV